MMLLEDQGYRAKMLLDSISPDGVRLTTMEVTFPRFHLAEFNTHRMFSRNSASSRAIPIEKQIQRLLDNPCCPVFWGKNQKGMQAQEEISEKEEAQSTWLQARDVAIQQARILVMLGVHKQLVNRLLEPFMWQTVIVSATEWSNFFGLRCHQDTQPELRKIACMMYQLYIQHIPQPVSFGYWHLPLLYVNGGQMLFPEDLQGIEFLAQEFSISKMEIMKRISAGRCARVSYLTHDGKRDLKADLELFTSLSNNGHCSPTEHIATPMDQGCGDEFDGNSEIRAQQWSGNFRGWKQFRAELIHQADFSKKFGIQI